MKRMFAQQDEQHEVHELCRRFGAPFVISTARNWIDAKERAAAEEHRRIRDEAIAAIRAQEGDKQ